MTSSVEKRFLALFLAFVMVFSLLPWWTVEVQAKDTSGSAKEYSYSAELSVTKTDKTKDSTGIC